MILAVRVKLVVAEDPAQAVPGVQVSLYDRDAITEDDLLDSGVSDAQGQVHFRFDSDQFKDVDDEPEWRIDSLPDLYVVVTDARGQLILSTRDRAIDNKLPNEIRVPIGRELLQAHGVT